jgi:ribonucleoside-diphosphate reductase alpha chain
VLIRRYLLKGESGQVVETPIKLAKRVAGAVACSESRYGGNAEKWAQLFFEAMTRLEFLPNSPTLMNAGRDLGQLSACFVLPVGDSLADIFDSVKWSALIQQTGGGTGFSFSSLRPSGDLVSSTQGVASGPVSFIEVFNTATDAIRQGGVRRGANMAVLRVDHPDILEFIKVKGHSARLRNFNLSVAVTDEFMAALRRDGDYALINPRTRREVGRLRAKSVWEHMTQSAWQSGEPGVIFIDRVNAENPTPMVGDMESTNPCGELPLLPFESCNLGSIDVSKFVVEEENGANFDWPRLASCIQLGIRFLDDVIDANRYLLAPIEEITRRNRKVGLGIMGFADALIQMRVPYDSERALTIGDELADFLALESQKVTERLAKERGSFPNFEVSRWSRIGRAPMRNATTTTIAPTGTLSILAGCSSGIEPLYAVSYVRQILDGERFAETHPLFLRRAQEEGWFSEALLEKVASHGSIRPLVEIPKEVRRVFVTAYDIAPEWHVKMQATFQRHIHNAVSKTINFPENASVAEVERAYALAFALGCKGVTVFRDQSREAQVLSFGPDGIQKR